MTVELATRIGLIGKPLSNGLDLPAALTFAVDSAGLIAAVGDADLGG